MGTRTARRTVYPPVARGSFSTPLSTRSTARPGRVRGRASGGTGSWLTLTDVVLLGCGGALVASWVAGPPHGPRPDRCGGHRPGSRAGAHGAGCEHTPRRRGAVR